MSLPTAEEFAEMFKAFRPVEPPEYRLYYDDEGNVVCYTCEKLKGKYLVVTANVYFASRYDITVVNSRIKYLADYVTLTKLEPSDSGIKCAKEDINIIVDDSYDGETITWNTVKYEYEHN